MIALRYVYVLALVIWLGGMAVLGAIVAPATFQVLQAQPQVLGRVLAGNVFGAVLDRFYYAAYACGAVLLLTLVAMAVLGPRPAAFGVRSAIITIMLAIALYSGIAVSGAIKGLQHAIGERVSPSTLPATDERRVRFDRLHQLSTSLMMVNMVGALILLYWEAKE